MTTIEEHEFSEETPCLHPEIVDGRLRLQVYFDSADSTFHAAAKSHCFDTDEKSNTVLSSHFSVSLVLDDIINLHELWNNPEPRPLHEDAKPLIQALKVELQQMLDRIETLTFAK